MRKCSNFLVICLVVQIFTIAFCIAQEQTSSQNQISQNQSSHADHDAHPRLEFRKWSGTINVPDPVAVSVDPQGVVYATQTKRRGIQDLDIRSHSEWIPDDVGLQSIAQKSEFFKRVLAIGGDDNEQSNQIHLSCKYAHWNYSASFSQRLASNCLKM